MKGGMFLIRYYESTSILFLFITVEVSVMVH